VAEFKYLGTVLQVKIMWPRTSEKIDLRRILATMWFRIFSLSACHLKATIKYTIIICLFYMHMICGLLHWS